MDRILFFDGICIMCNNLIRFVLRHDKKRLFKFATLQGKTAEKLLPPDYKNELKTIVLLDDKGFHTESDAILRLLLGLGGIFSLVNIVKIIPKIIRDKVYRFIAKNRYSWFGTTESCALLNQEERRRILD